MLKKHINIRKISSSSNILFVWISYTTQSIYYIAVTRILYLFKSHIPLHVFKIYIYIYIYEGGGKYFNSYTNIVLLRKWRLKGKKFFLNFFDPRG